MFKCQRCSGVHESASECTHHDRETKELKLNALAEELYGESNRMFTPMFPWVFVRVLKKQQQVGSIILPDIDQNKTVAEGIVLAVWKMHPRRQYKDYKESTLAPGDHVLFNYWAGVPITGHKPEYYRCVKECNWAIDKEGGIFAKVEYANKNTRPIEKLRPVIERTITEYDSDTEEEHCANVASVLRQIEDQFLLVDRDGESVTLSGR